MLLTCPYCEGEGTDWNDFDPCPRCKGNKKLPAAELIGEELDKDHLRVSPDGWHCDVCGIAVNGQTDDSGIPLHDGESVRHTP